MKRLLLIFIFFILIMPIFGQEDSTFYYYHLLEHEKNIKYFKKILKKNDYKNNLISKGVDIHNLACAYSMVKDYKKCFETLNTLLKNNGGDEGFYYDPDFYNVSQTKEWKDLLINYKNKKKLNFQDTVFLTLSQIAINDQAFYNDIAFYEKKYGQKSSKVSALWTIKDSLNKANLKLVNHYIDKGYNVLSDSVVTYRFASKCFLVIQHSDQKTMEYYLPIIKDLFDRKQTKGSNYALLYDRVSVNKNKGVQYYGTQVNTDANQPYEIKDEKNVDKRRAELGMETMASYLQRFNIIYKPKRKK